MTSPASTGAQVCQDMMDRKAFAGPAKNNDAEMLKVAASHVTALRGAIKEMLALLAEIESRDRNNNPRHSLWLRDGKGAIAVRHGQMVLRPAWPPPAFK